MRNRVSPIFTSGKLKGMTSYMDKVADNMIEHLIETIESKGQIVLVKFCLYLYQFIFVEFFTHF